MDPNDNADPGDEHRAPQLIAVLRRGVKEMTATMPRSFIVMVDRDMLYLMERAQHHGMLAELCAEQGRIDALELRRGVLGKISDLELFPLVKPIGRLWPGPLAPENPTPRGPAMRRRFKVPR